MTFDRTKGIGGTDIGAIVGLKPFGRTAYDVWLEKTGRVKGQPDKKEFAIGRRLEPIVLDMIWDAMGQPARTFPGEVVNKDRPWQVVHPDAAVVEKTVVEAKTAGAYNAHEWGEEGSDDVPKQYIAQVAWYLSALGWDRGVLGVLIGGSDFRTYRINRDEALEDFLLEHGQLFWEKCVQADIPPPLEASPTVDRWLKERFPESRNAMRQATDSERELALRYQGVLEKFEKIEEVRDTLKAQLKVAVGDAAGIEGDFGRITWRKAKSSTRVDWEAVARYGIDEEKLEQILPKHTICVEGSRRFLTNWK